MKHDGAIAVLEARRRVATRDASLALDDARQARVMADGHTEDAERKLGLAKECEDAIKALGGTPADLARTGRAD